MIIPSHADAFQVLLLQAADQGRGPILFGDSQDRARSAVLPFLIGGKFPSVYLEHPLIGEPFLDVTVLYGELDMGSRIDSPMAEGTDALLDWYGKTRPGREHVSFGFEIDTKDPSLPAAAVHLQPFAHTQLVEPFCALIGEPERADLYLEQAKRMPGTWPLAFFGMFRGRPGSPLRICGYLGRSEINACADPAHLAHRFDEIGFGAYDDTMLEQVSRLMAAAPGSVDFQFDVYPDMSLSSTFAIDVQFEIEQPEAVTASFAHGPGWRIMGLFEEWGVADRRWQLGAEAAFARSLPMELEDGTLGCYAFTVMPQWTKARWINGTLQPTKLYQFVHAGLV